MATVVEFCGERWPLDPERSFTVGREADLAIDDNPFLHRRFLEISHQGGLWWLSNVGTQLAATLADEAGLVNAWLAPGARLPIVFERTSVWFTAGPTNYELIVLADVAPFATTPQAAPVPAGATTTGRTELTPDQRLLLIGLTEPMLRRGRGGAAMPTSAAVAERLGWPLTTFNRKLDSVCEKLERQGVQGLHGGPGKLASSRKSRLAEYAIASRLVTVDDLALLELIGKKDTPVKNTPEGATDGRAIVRFPNV